MQPEQKQRIIKHFIRETGERLSTIESGLLDLQRTLEDPETISELLRAAHSIKGDAAMLELDSIQQIARWLEDCFRILKDHTLPADPELQSLCSQLLAGLRQLWQQLHDSSGLTAEQTRAVLTTVKPARDALNVHLAHIVPSLAAKSRGSSASSGTPDVTPEELNELAAVLENFNPDTQQDDNDDWAIQEEALTSLLEEDFRANSQSLREGTSVADGEEQTSGQTPTPLTAPEQRDEEDFDLLGERQADDKAGVSQREGLDSFATPLELASPEDFPELDSLFAEPVSEEIPAAATQTPGAASAADIAEFDTLEKMLQESERTASTSSSSAVSQEQAQQLSQQPPRRLIEPTMRVPVKNLDNLSNLVGELVISRNSLEQNQERLRHFLSNLLYQVQQLGDVGQRLQDLYERSLLETSLMASSESFRSLQQPSRPSVDRHVTGTNFDALEMDQFTGFHTLSQEMIEFIVRVREAASDIEFVSEETSQLTRQFRQITTQLQEDLTRSRMIPFAQAADRLPRAVRDISLKCGKQAELTVEGRETLIDKMLLEQLYDPMTHLVNNAITHGIELPETREAMGKLPAGHIRIQVFYQGNQTVISVSDDGSGIDTEKVRVKAINKGLITSDQAQDMSQLDIYDLIFHPGFSTRDQADDFAGRGVGMDVVRTALSEIRGSITIDSIPGQGTTFTIRLPLTLSISKALCCVSNRARIAFPMDGVEDMLDIPTDDVQINATGQSCLFWRDGLLPFRPLAELLRYNRQLGRGSIYSGPQEDDIISIIVLRSSGSFLAVQVDRVLGEQEIVIKQLEAPVSKPIGVAGVTVLGDGQIMPIADVLELVDIATGRVRQDIPGPLKQEAVPAVSESRTQSEPVVLIVDDSITVRELLSMTFRKVGYRVEQARDGQEAWEKLRSGLPCDLVFCDIEMPRMDGLELLSRLQKDPQLQPLPIAMLTSRGAERHQQMATQLGASGYFIKPYLEEALLDGAQRMLRGEILVGQRESVSTPEERMM